MPVEFYGGHKYGLGERGWVHTVAQQVPGRIGMRSEWIDERDGWDITIQLGSPDGDLCELRLTAQEAFDIAVDLLQDVRLAQANRELEWERGA